MTPVLQYVSHHEGMYRSNPHSIFSLTAINVHFPGTKKKSRSPSGTRMQTMESRVSGDTLKLPLHNADRHGVLVKSLGHPTKGIKGNHQHIYVDTVTGRGGGKQISHGEGRAIGSTWGGGGLFFSFSANYYFLFQNQTRNLFPWWIYFLYVWRE